MTALQPFLIAGSDQGLELDKKSFLLPDKAFVKLNNAYVWRDEVRKREGLTYSGRLRRVITAATASLTTPAADTITINNIFAYLDLSRVAGLLSAATQANPGSITTSTNHNLVTGDQVTINNVVGMTELNGNTYTVTVTGVTTFTIGVDTTGFTIYTSGGDWTTQPDAEIDRFVTITNTGTLVITVGAPDASTFTDDGDGTFTVTGLGDASGSYINYATGQVVLKFSVALTGGAIVTADIKYFPSLPVMGIINRERSSINNEETLVFDTKYTYAYDNTNYDEYLPATNTTWAADDDDFFWGTNFIGSDSSNRLLFVTNFVNDASNPMRYTNGASWTDFTPSIAGTLVTSEVLGTLTTPWTNFAASTTNVNVIPGTVTITVSNGTDFDVIYTDPTGSGTLTGSSSTNSGTITYPSGAVSAVALTINPAMTVDATVTITYQYVTSTLWQARLLIPYYGRLLAFNTWEGATRAGASKYFNRVRFSQVGSPTQTDAWISTIFGKGGFIDAPTAEEILSVKFYKNTLTVYFERSTWNLRYVGEYGLPFVWDKISSDFGSESPHSTILFDEGVLAVGDRAIISATDQKVQRIDEKIPDKIFEFKNVLSGTLRVQGIRDFRKELVYWTYPDGTKMRDSTSQKFPTDTLVYNYKNNTFANFRNSITAFGQTQDSKAILWNRTDIFWSNYSVFWKDEKTNAEFPTILAGNQQGFMFTYGYQSKDDQSLTITGVDRTQALLRFTITNHNLFQNEIIYINDLTFIDTSDSSAVTTDLNDQTYQIANVVDANTIEVQRWNVFTGQVSGATQANPGEITTPIAHKLTTGDLVTIVNVDGMTELNNNTYTITVTAATTFTIGDDTSTFTAYIGNGNWTSEPSVRQYENNFSYTPASGTGTYVGIGTAALLPKMEIQTKDFNPFITEGKSIKLGYLDLLTDASTEGTVTLTIFTDTSTQESGNLMVGNTKIPTYNVTPYNNPSSSISWHRFFSTVYGQFISVMITYDDAEMNDINILNQPFIMNALSLFIKPGGRLSN